MASRDHRQVYLRTLRSADRNDFVAAMRASRKLHGRWASPPTTAHRRSSDGRCAACPPRSRNRTCTHSCKCARSAHPGKVNVAQLAIRAQGKQGSTPLMKGWLVWPCFVQGGSCQAAHSKALAPVSLGSPQPSGVTGVTLRVVKGTGIRYLMRDEGIAAYWPHLAKSAQFAVSLGPFGHQCPIRQPNR
jgi:hypothetical protein